MFTLFRTRRYTHTWKHYLLFISRKEAKLLLKFRNICHEINTTHYGKQEVIFYTFSLIYLCIFFTTTEYQIKR